MSLFLGKIHFWVYNKIIWAEELEKDIINFAWQKKLPIDTWVKNNIEKYGEPVNAKPLDQIIDTTNIHGWLQEKINSTELRQAELITLILKENPNYMDEISEIFRKQGEAAAIDYGNMPAVPEGIFTALHDFIVEGMPCDRINEVIESSENEFVWKTTRCLHSPYWNQVGGEVQNFYSLRNAWVKSFVEKINPIFTYTRDANGINRINKK